MWYIDSMQHIEHNPTEHTVTYQNTTGEYLTWQQVEEDIAEYLETKAPGARITQVAPADGPGWWYAEYEGEHTMTTPTPTQQLHTFYNIAVATGSSPNTDTHFYLEIMDDLHLSLKAVVLGDDPTDTIKDQANEWLVDASHCGSEKTAKLFKAWASMLKDVV